MQLVKPQPLNLAQTQTEFDEQAYLFLTIHGFPVTSDFLVYYGAGIQQATQQEKDITEAELIAFIKRRHANSLAYNLIKGAVKRHQEAQGGSEAQKAPEALVQEAKS